MLWPSLYIFCNYRLSRAGKDYTEGSFRWWRLQGLPAGTSSLRRVELYDTSYSAGHLQCSLKCSLIFPIYFSNNIIFILVQMLITLLIKGKKLEFFPAILPLITVPFNGNLLSDCFPVLTPLQLDCHFCFFPQMGLLKFIIFNNIYAHLCTCVYIQPFYMMLMVHNSECSKIKEKNFIPTLDFGAPILFLSRGILCVYEHTYAHTLFITQK